ncbi:hypothetical protein [Streptomyces resistomycificus]|uniref:Membrane protein n=1 Tax=Streptomyces resistomycificus TaxID=67356 RepID=A0A0L8L762_9ACTN|nr:hypothetical protein [Streptomyces resistomycificus]KOG33992.1 membrane protein [Streptomyces resistomycificus]KUN96496.1 hypothetical protein AQJ84_19150 [Streptomyces resistomycificus]
MGIESDQVVYEYLSRVGDVAQQRQLSSAVRMRLVSELRNEIDRRRAKATVDSPAAVRRIIAHLGSPDEVVEAAGGTAGAPQAPPAHVPVQRDREREPEDSGGGRAKGLRRVVPRPRPERASPDPAPSDVPSPPHMASMDELGDSATQPDWWRVDSSAFGVGDSVPGFVGGVEIPELLKPPPKPEPEAEPETTEERPAPTVQKKAGALGRLVRLTKPAPAPPAPAAVEAPATRRRFRLLGGGAAGAAGSGGWSNPFLLLAAGLLVAGAVLGNWIALVLGWAIAYASRRLSDAETKLAVVILPGLSLTAGAVWLWGRTEGRWGEPIAEGHMNAAMAQTWPWVVRGAAVASALFLVWRSQRRR